ncbi:hypothetical protein GGR54DRAFT_159119 [Hypoxylon sp. NC1633]|nr:hypothetical protein GGR54DRAFT_159119 [Hypoxylon sp. NC1633]
MPYLWGPLRALRLAAALAATASATIVRPGAVFERADTNTCAADFSRCIQAGLPGNFCCESTATCIPLAGNTTVLCCPKGSSCDKIFPITCDIQSQDPVKNPTAEIKTTALTGTLEACGSTCCPFGYHCSGGGCVIDKDQSQKPVTKPAPTSASTPTPSSASTSVSTRASTTVAVSGIPTTAPSAPSGPSSSASPDTSTTSSTSTNTMAIIGGAIGGVIALIVLIVFIVLARVRRGRRRRSEKDVASQRHDSTSSFGNIISAPVPHANYPSQRLDFLAKGAATATTTDSLASPRTAHTAASTARSYAAYDYPGRDADVSGERGRGDDRVGFGSPYDSPYAPRPVSDISDAPPRSYHPSAEIGGLRSLTHGKRDTNAPVPAQAQAPTLTVTPADGRPRGGSGGSESINIFADPTVRGVGGGGRPASAATTWSNIQQRADNSRAPRLGDPATRWR